VVDVPQILGASRGHVVAPAGCGKTELIARSVATPGPKPTLILTHTTAGVAALRQRLKRDGVPAGHYRLNTIAGWALSMVSMFPERAGFRQDPLAAPNYAQVQSAIGRLCQSGNVTREIQATYGRLLVDEYQDCSVTQHAIVSGIANAIPTVVFGDPMQAIFGFGADPLADWHSDVTGAFPELGRLSTPWRWSNVGANDLGLWLLGARETLSQGAPIDLRTCPNGVFWHQIGSDTNATIAEQIRVQFEISRRNTNESILIVGDPMRAGARHDYASRAAGVSVVEPVDFRDVVGAAENMDGLTGEALLQACIAFLILVMTNVYGDRLQQRIQSIRAGRHRSPPNPQELAGIALFERGAYPQAIAFLKSMASDRERRIYRHSAFGIMIEALSMAASGKVDLRSAIAMLRERNRQAGRIVPSKAVGSTLLLKGLEAQHVIILDADQPGAAMSRQHLYVALTRGARSAHIFSRRPVLPA
jgi:hypothetical protein